jgi:hypothetical protein
VQVLAHIIAQMAHSTAAIIYGLELIISFSVCLEERMSLSAVQSAARMPWRR